MAPARKRRLDNQAILARPYRHAKTDPYSISLSEIAVAAALLFVASLLIAWLAHFAGQPQSASFDSTKAARPVLLSLSDVVSIPTSVADTSTGEFRSNLADNMFTEVPKWLITSHTA